MRRTGAFAGAVATASPRPRSPSRRAFPGTGASSAVASAGVRQRAIGRRHMGRKRKVAGWYFKRVLVLVLVIVIVAPVVGYFAVPSFKDRVNSLFGQGGTSALLLQHPSTLAADGNIKTFWLADQTSGADNAHDQPSPGDGPQGCEIQYWGARPGLLDLRPC